LGIDDENFITHTPIIIATDISTIVQAANRPFNAARMSSEVRYLGVQATKQLEDGPLSSTFSVSVLGTATWKIPPNNAAVLVNKVTAGGGRRNRGRMFVCPSGVNEANADATGFMVSGDLTNIQADWSTAFAAMTAAGYNPVIFHATAPFTPTPITNLSVQQQMATQRRRMRR